MSIIPPDDQNSYNNENTPIETGGFPNPPQNEPEIKSSPNPQFSPSSNQEIPKQAVEVSKEAVLDVWSAFKLIWNDPVTGLQAAITALGDSRAFNAGIALCVIFIISIWLVASKAIQSFFSFGSLLSGGSSPQLDITNHIKIIIGATISVVGMIAILWGVRQIFRGSGNLKHFTFVTGFCLTPITFLLLCTWLLAPGGVEVISLLSVFCSTTLTLFLNTALIEVLQLSPRNALLLVPIILVAEMFIIRVGLEILY